MQARLVCVVFSVWLFAIAEQVTAVRDVLCLSYKPKSNRSERRSGRYRNVSSEPRPLELITPRVPLCIVCDP